MNQGFYGKHALVVIGNTCRVKVAFVVFMREQWIFQFTEIQLEQARRNIDVMFLG